MHKNLTIAAMILMASVAVGCAGHGVKSENAGAGTATSNTAATSGAGAQGTEETTKAGPDISQRSIYFDFDRSDIKPEYQSIISNHAKYLADHPTVRVRLEGNTDERGTREYNIGLGERRADAVMQALMVHGVSQQQISVVSFGEERPVCTEHNEQCWAKNRRVDIVYQ